MDKPKQTPLSEQKKQALDEYTRVSAIAHSYSSVIPTAIEYYFDNIPFKELPEVTKVYKLRYETAHDVFQFMSLARPRVEFLPEESDGTEFTFASSLDLNELLFIISNVPDGHRMQQTLALLEDYTGDAIIRK